MTADKKGLESLSSSDDPIKIEFDNSYFKQLSGLYREQLPETAPAPTLIKFNRDLASELNIEHHQATNQQLAEIFSGNKRLAGSNPIAQAYAGHQFGHYNPQLGDGRAVLLGEVVDNSGARRDIQLKGSGRTPFSRSGDGKAALGPVLREYLVSEAMHALGIPTTRALAAVTTGEEVWRNEPQIGATLTRTASSHIRIGTFQYVAANYGVEEVQRLADYVMERHYPQARASDSPYLELLDLVCQQQALLISKWKLVGFIHGVMNTDNMAISGETIDYGPCAFMDSYDPETVYSSIDSEGRYAYRNQPYIAQWNLARFAESILPLIADNEDRAIELATSTLHRFMDHYQQHWQRGMLAKIGINDQQEGDEELVLTLLDIMEQHSVDFTQFFRSLSSVIKDEQQLESSPLAKSKAWLEWKPVWLDRVKNSATPIEESIALMQRNNPIYIPRNHKVEEIIQAAQDGNFEPFERMLAVLGSPFEEQQGCEEFARPAPSSFGPYRTFCGT